MSQEYRAYMTWLLQINQRSLSYVWRWLQLSIVQVILRLAPLDPGSVLAVVYNHVVMIHISPQYRFEP